MRKEDLSDKTELRHYEQNLGDQFEEMTPGSGVGIGGFIHSGKGYVGLFQGEHFVGISVERWDEFLSVVVKVSPEVVRMLKARLEEESKSNPA